jgi:hypothetical protein
MVYCNARSEAGEVRLPPDFPQITNPRPVRGA